MAFVGACLKFVRVSFRLPSFSFSSICESESEALVLYSVAQSVPFLVLRGLSRILSLALMFGAHIALERVDFLHHVRQHFPSPTHLFLKHHNFPFPAHLASVFNLCPPMLPHVASRQCHLWPSSFSVRQDNFPWWELLSDDVRSQNMSCTCMHP